ncbi:spore coat protein [Clostridium aminobutyricum]|uniref:Spore coat protein n=1 Tax=Clostridium aminobutyricum TaxID=33953 RepID=A0A939IIC7_CLOAM|nr:spore coat protein [Clostridium aminobutyricum]MBN7772423.1 spore coat protein [Clostridium aminobutyricum]
MITLTQKETSLLQDSKKQEEICIEKYERYSSEASDPQLQDLFRQLGSKEREHLNSINQILSGTVPNVNAGGQGNQQQMQQQMQQKMQAMPQLQAQSAVSGNQSKSDAYLCTDALSTEKHVSAVYDTAIFEFKDASIRQVLNHIQKEEQEHGEKIYNYMAQHGMYN